MWEERGARRRGGPPGTATTGTPDPQKACRFVWGNICAAEPSKWQAGGHPGPRPQGQQSEPAGTPARVLGWVLKGLQQTHPGGFPETLSTSQDTPLTLRAPWESSWGPRGP